MTQLDITEAADALTEANKRWKLFDNRGEVLVLRTPDAGSNLQSKDGETMRFWRFDTKAAAERFRNRKVLNELAMLTEGAS